MTEHVVTKEYIIFGIEDYNEARKYISQPAYFDDTIEDVMMQLNSKDFSFCDYFCSILIDAYSTHYYDGNTYFNYVAVEKLKE